jgi:ribonuclease HI
LSLFKIYKKSSPKHKKFINIISLPYVIATKTFFSLKHQAFQIFLKINNINTFHTTNPHSSDPNNYNLKNTYDLIHTALICPLPVKENLFNLAKSFINYNSFIFYTDGSVKNLGTSECKSGYGWIQTHPNTPRETFKGSTLFFPSSTKSETMAIMTALITIPKNSTCTIITDSANCVDMLKDRLKNPITSPRRRLKLNNYLIWDLIMWIIEHHNLTINIEKIKAHSGDKYNDQADILAKAGSECQNPIIVNFKFFNKTSLGFFNWNHIYIVDRNIRTFANTPIQATIFNSVVSNSSLMPLNDHIINGSIDWYFTKLWINYNHYDSPTCEKLSRKQGSKIKKANFLYPTLDTSQRNYPKLYPSTKLPCTLCRTYTDSNLHIALCQHHQPIFHNLLQKHKEKLYNLLENNSTTFTFDLRSRLNASPLFTSSTHDPSSETLPILQPNLLLIYNLIPTELTCFFYNYIGRQQTRNQIFLTFITDLIQDINYNIWRGYRQSTSQWELTLNITPKKK